MVAGSPDAVIAATSFLCRTFRGTCGRNWVIVGEAASQSDPITGNGVTAALRHADEGSALMLRYRRRGAMPLPARWAYSLRVLGMGRYFNSLIEKLYYEPPVRSLTGVFVVAETYTVPAWLTNVVYSRVKPRRLAGTLAICAVLATLRGVAWGVGRASQFLSSRARS